MNFFVVFVSFVVNDLDLKTRDHSSLKTIDGSSAAARRAGR